VKLAVLLERAGTDLIDVTGGWHETRIPQLPGDLPRGGFAYLAGAVQDAVTIPVLTANRHNDPAEAETTLALEEARLIGLARPLLADPDWPEKARTGRAAVLRPCVACNQGCLAKMFFGQPVECLVNPQAGREYLLAGDRGDATTSAPKTARTPQKRLLVIGGGPAGCAFATGAAEKGHKVTLWEKQDRLGGQLHLVKAPPGKREFGELIRYYEAALKEAGVTLVLRKEATAGDIRKAGFDAVILATGARAKRFPLPGNGRIPVYTAAEILEGREIAGRRVVVAGGAAAGCETAQYLAREGALREEQLYFMMSHRSESDALIRSLLDNSRREIAVVDIAKVGGGFDPGCAWPVMKDLKRLNVKTHSFSKIADTTDGHVILEKEDESSGKPVRVELACDAVVLAVGSEPDDGLFQELKEDGIPLHRIGDAAAVGKIIDALRQADALAREE
jgi:2,4-dienoyl-CoA reductase (NADPH2)